MPIALQPPRADRVLPQRERTPRRVSTRDAIKVDKSRPRTSSASLILGAVAALVLLALPLPLLLDGTVSIAPRMGLLGIFIVPPVIFMAIVQSRYGNGKNDS